MKEQNKQKRRAIAKDRKYWVEGDGLDVVRKWVMEECLFDYQIAKRIGINVTTLRIWRSKYPQFGEMFTVTKDDWNPALEGAAFDMATGYYYEEEILDLKGNIRKIQRFAQPSPTMNMFMLKNRMPKEYKDKQNLEVEGRIPVVLTDDGNLKD